MSAAGRKSRARGKRDRQRQHPVRGWVAAGVAVALVATIAVFASGFDAREMPREEAAVWVTRDAGQYARVNTDTGELDIVRRVADPSAVIQQAAAAAVLTDGNGRAWPVNAADPADLGAAPNADDEAASTVAAAETAARGDAVRLPDGTRDIVSAGNSVALRTEAGVVYLGQLGTSDSGNQHDAVDSDLRALQRLVPSGAETPEDAEAPTSSPGYVATAIAVAPTGALAVYSTTEHTVRSYRPGDPLELGAPQELPGEPVPAPQLTIVDGRWALLNTETGVLLREGNDTPVVTDAAAGAQLQSSGVSDDGAVLIADTSGLLRVASDGAVSRVVETNGVPTQPTQVGEEWYAAWLGQNAGTLWSVSDGERELAIDAAAAEQGEFHPEIRSNGTRAVLAETTTGMLWTLPEGRAIPLSQWTISDPPQQERGTVVVEEVTEQVPPTAVDDAFGVREGGVVPLPVLLNDYDANARDVLTIVPESLTDTPLPPEFGELSLLGDGQSLTVRVAPGATGTASFTYRVSDGGRESEPATVTLTVVDEGVNSPPAWCPVDGCQLPWQVPSLAPGGTLVTPALHGWVDPEGDVMSLISAEVLRTDVPARAMVTADGDVAIRHSDPNAGAAEVTVRLVVRDSRGAETARDLQVVIDPAAQPEFTSMATTVRAGDSTLVHPMTRAAGGSGSYALVDAALQSGAGVTFERQSDGSVRVRAESEGTATAAVTLRDTVTGSEATGQLRVTATAAGPELALPPLRAFVRPLSDATVEVLTAIPGAESRALSVVNATVLTGELSADIVDHANVRVAGATPTGEAGKIGELAVTVAEGDAQATGRMTVFQVPDVGAAETIAVADAATVRAGAVVDIRVLDNDVAGPGERLVLHPEVVGSGAPGELAFASGNVLRYVAPAEPGIYRLSYTSYGASDPSASDTGTVTVEVLPTGANRDPQPADLIARVSAGATTQITVPVSGVDPDGDRVRLLGVMASDQPGLTAALTPAGTGIAVTASPTATPGVTRLGYTVRDPYGGAATGTLNVMVMPGETGSAPIVSTDYVRATPGGAAMPVRPLENDLDPAGGALSILTVTPNVAGGEDSPEYQRLAALVDDTAMRTGELKIRPGDTLGTVSYRYTVSSSASQSTADGLIVVQTSERVGIQAPRVQDTVITVRDRAQLENGGVDVVTDRVRWATGDPAQLQLSLWKDAAEESEAGYRVTGSRIRGAYDPEGDTVVFRLAGTDAAGAKVESYGLLIIPPLDELRLTVQPDLPPLTVNEDGQAEIQLRDLVEAGSDDDIELRRGSFHTARAQAVCEATSASVVRYTAGSAGPWTDVCLVEAKLAGQKQWSSVPLQLTIVPRTPTAAAAPLARTVPPGAVETVSLLDMISWQGGRVGDPGALQFATSGGGSAFQVSAAGAELTVRARADAVPGTQETITVSVSGAGESSAALTLRVGTAARDLPRGATVPLRCTVGEPCTVDVVGASGEHDPFAGSDGAGLRLTGVDDAGCRLGTLARVGERGVTVQWADAGGVGGTCTASFSVRDAQGRVGSGAVELDAQGLPAAPSIVQSGFDATSATFLVSLGQGSYPAARGVALTGAGAGTCVAAGGTSYRCVATGLVNGDQHVFTARAENAVGQSAESNGVRAWAYAAPAAPEVTIESLPDAGNTDQNQGGVRLRVTGDREVSRYEISSSTHAAVSAQLPGSGGTQELTGLGVGPITVNVTPLTRFEVPPIGGVAAGAVKSVSGTVIGAPRLLSATLTPTGDSTAEVTYDGTESAAARYVLSGPDGEPAACSAGQPGASFQNLRLYRGYQVRVCLSTEFGRSEAVSERRVMGSRLPAPEASYTISPTPAASGGSFSYGVTAAEIVTTSTGEGRATGQWRIGGTVVAADRFVLTPDARPAVEARQCLDVQDQRSCSEWVSVQGTNAPAPVLVGPHPDPAVCWDPQAPPTTLAARLALLSVSGAASGSVSEVTAGEVLNGFIPLTVRWAAPFAALEPAVVSVCVSEADGTGDTGGG